MHAKKRHSAHKTAGRPIRGADKIKALSAGSPRAHRRTRPRPRITEARRPLSWREHGEVRAMLDTYALPPRRRPTP